MPATQTQSFGGNHWLASDSQERTNKASSRLCSSFKSNEVFSWEPEHVTGRAKWAFPAVSDKCPVARSVSGRRGEAGVRDPRLQQKQRSEPPVTPGSASLLGQTEPASCLKRKADPGGKQSQFP